MKMTKCYREDETMQKVCFSPSFRVICPLRVFEIVTPRKSKPTKRNAPAARIGNPIIHGLSKRPDTLLEIDWTSRVT